LGKLTMLHWMAGKRNQSQGLHGLGEKAGETNKHSVHKVQSGSLADFDEKQNYIAISFQALYPEIDQLSIL
jgi:hypothetical protein